MKAIILAGGVGSRMGEISKIIPKPLIPVCGKPVLERQIETLRQEGITEFIIITGYLGRQIEDYFGDGSAFGTEISYYFESTPLGTGGALFKLGLTEDFLLCSGDLVFNFNLERMLSYHREKDALATLFVHPNSHPYDSTLVKVSPDGAVTDFVTPENRKDDCENLCNAGVQLVSPRLLGLYGVDGRADFDRDLIKPAISTGKIFAYRSFEYVRDMGTPERLKVVEADIEKGIVECRNIRKKQKAVFLDRDGTLNVHNGYITSPDELELIEDAAEAVREINSLGYLAVIVTNQPVVARGDCTEAQLKEIHNRLEALLGEKGAYVDGIYYCPHHPDSGFPEEVKELKIKCNCRKPSPGMLLRAAVDFNIDMSESFMAGDSVNDVEAGLAAGCKAVFIGEAQVPDTDKIVHCKSLYDFSKQLKNGLLC